MSDDNDNEEICDVDYNQDMNEDDTIKEMTIINEQ